MYLYSVNKDRRSIKAKDTFISRSSYTRRKKQKSKSEYLRMYDQHMMPKAPLVRALSYYFLVLFATVFMTIAAMT